MPEPVATTLRDRLGISHFVIGIDPPYGAKTGLAVFYYGVEIDGDAWRRGDVFWVMDDYGAPRQHSFQYWNATNEDIVCYRHQRYRRKGAGHLHAGYVSMVPSRATDITVSGDNLAFVQLMADLTAIERHADVAAFERDWKDATATVRVRILEQAQRTVDTYDDRYIEDEPPL